VPVLAEIGPQPDADTAALTKDAAASATTETTGLTFMATPDA
jgi:hypothetical protein